MGEKVEKVSGSLLGGFIVSGTGVLPNIRRQVDTFNTPVFLQTGSTTLTVNQVVRGIILHDTNAGNVTDTLPTAADFIAGVANVYRLAHDNDSIEFAIKNDGLNILTLQAGANTNLQGDYVIPAGQYRTVTVVRTSGTTAVALVSNPLAASGQVPVRSSVITTAGAATYSAAQYLGGYIARDPNGNNRTDVTPTGAQIDSANPQLTVGSYFDTTIKNTADAVESITLNGGVGVTLISAIVIADSETAVLRTVKTGTATYDVVQLG